MNAFTQKVMVPRLLASFGTVALLTGLGLAASRPARSVGGPVAVSVANTPLATAPTDEAAPKQPFQAETSYVIPDGKTAAALIPETPTRTSLSPPANGLSSKPSACSATVPLMVSGPLPTLEPP